MSPVPGMPTPVGDTVTTSVKTVRRVNNTFTGTNIFNHPVNGTATGNAALVHGHTVQTLAYVAKTANYTLTDTDGIVDCTSGSFTLTLPTAVGITGRTYYLKNSGTGTITAATTSSQTIDGEATQSLSAKTALTVASDGANWIVL